MGRLLILLYGVLSYALALVALAYLVAFVGNFDNLPFVTKTIDNGVAGSLGPSMLINIALLVLFSSTHSIMARPWFKERWTKVIPHAMERSTYVLVSAVTLLVLYYYWQPMPDIIWQLESNFWIYVLWGVSLAGYAIVLISTFLINHFELFGLEQIYTNFTGKAPSGFKFVQPLFYKLVRHPLYTGFVLAFWSTPTMSAGHFLFATMMTAEILIAIPHEEKDIASLLGERYKKYLNEVPMLIPFMKIK
ncbi:MAG: NnrU family protein [Emcibacteraceae bacterium]